MRLPEPATRAAAWAGAALFALSITCFLYTYAVTFAAQPTGSLSPMDVTVNVLLFVAFAFHHSLFARLAVRAWVARTVPERYERTLYVAIASVLLIAVCLAWRVLPGTLWQMTGISRWLMHALQVGGVVLTVWSRRRTPSADPKPTCRRAARIDSCVIRSTPAGCSLPSRCR